MNKNTALPQLTVLEVSKLPFEAPEFDKIVPSQFIPALEWATQDAQQKIDKLKKDSSLPTFENVILSLEESTEAVDRLSSLFFNLHSAEATEEIQNIAKDFSPMLSAFYSGIQLDIELFKKIQSLHNRQKELALNNEQKQLLETTYKSFLRNGAQLDEAKKSRVKEISEEMAKISPQYSENILKATNQFQLWIQDESDLAGLPDSARDAAAMAAKEKSKPNEWLFTLHAPSFIPLMTYSEKRDLREKMWRAYNSRAFEGQYSNQELCLKIAQLRFEKAKVLGFKSHAELALQERMAETPERVMDFLDKLLASSRPAAERELKEVQTYAQENGLVGDLQPWDFAFYSEKLKQQKYSFDQEELRPYFRLESVIAGTFELASHLYDIEFIQRNDLPVYNKDVQVFEVLNKKDRSHIGLFYADFFPRPTKRGGAWATSYREQGYQGGAVKRPLISIVCNFTKPTEDKPSLLTFDEVSTLFHEFGHALHGLLSQCTYRSHAGTNVYWDFVELPSQIMENWALEPEALRMFARHYQTEEPIPVELVKKLRRSSQFQAGYRTMRQLNFAFLDMAWHNQDPSQIKSVVDFEKEVTQKTRLLPAQEGTNSSVSFSHIFDGGYSAGYYSYKWAEVLDADAFEAFKERGVLNREVAQLFKTYILERGGSEHPMVLYKKFRGREPDPNALLRRDGLI